MGVRSPFTLGCLLAKMRTLALRTSRCGGPKCAAVVCGRERRVVGYCARHPGPRTDTGPFLTPNEELAVAACAVRRLRTDTPGQAGLPAEFKHINKRRRRNLQGFP